MSQKLASFLSLPTEIIPHYIPHSSTFLIKYFAFPCKSLRGSLFLFTWFTQKKKSVTKKRSNFIPEETLPTEQLPQSQHSKY